MKTRKRLPEGVYMERPLRDGVKLDANENPYPPSIEVLNAISEAAKYVNRYPPEPKALREALAGINGLDPGSVLVGAGSDELIDLIVKAYVGWGSKVATLYPTFPMYERFSIAAGGFVERIPLNHDFTLNLEQTVKTLSDGVEVFFIANPNNPTGLGFPLWQVEEILKLGVLTVVDEAYYEFSGRTALSLLEDYRNLVILRTFSKAYGLAGLRVGYLMASKEIVGNLLRVKPPYTVTLMAQRAALKILKRRDQVLEAVSFIRRARQRLYEELKGVKGVKPYPSEANFILIDVAETGLTSSQVAEALLKLGVSVRPLGGFEGFQGDFIRMTVGTARENKLFLSSLRRVLGED